MDRYRTPFYRLRNLRRAKQLGMNPGTASHRLKKSIMYDLLKRLNDTDCFRCGEPIKGPEELSIDHIQGWEGQDTALFWSLDNIAFSHHRCNSKNDTSFRPASVVDDASAS